VASRVTEMRSLFLNVRLDCTMSVLLSLIDAFALPTLAFLSIVSVFLLSYISSPSISRLPVCL